MATERYSVGRDPRATSKHKLVHEMSQGTAVASGQPTGANFRSFLGGAIQKRGVLEAEALLMSSIYIDLNPVAAKVAETPETSKYTSIKQRLDHVEVQGKTARLKAANGGSVAGSMAASGLEESHWLCPIEDRRGLDSAREGMIQGLSLGSYIKLVDYTGRLIRHGKASMSADLASISNAWDAPTRSWQSRIEKLAQGHCRPIFRNDSREAARDRRTPVRKTARQSARCPVR